MTETRCDCGDSECPSCGSAQGTRAIRGAEEDLSEADQMAVSGILTTQIFHSVFIRHEEPLLV